jgi:glyoxylase-like metal-dependent hydrolase (beta-lactamase superfamily II)
MTRALLLTLAFLPALSFLPASARAQVNIINIPQNNTWANVQTRPGIHAYKVQGNVWIIPYEGANIAMQTGPEGVILVDTGAAGQTDAVLAAIREVTTGPIRYIINTSISPDRVGGNEKLTALAGGSTDGKGKGPTPNTLAQDNVLRRMSTPGPNGVAPYPTLAWPTDGYIAERRALHFNGEVVEILHQPNAHSDGDTLVYFRSSDVLVSGDLFSTTNFPLIDAKLGGTYQGMLDALNRMVDIAVPEVLQEGGTMIIPGRGRICDQADLVEYRDMVTEFGQRMQNLVGKQHMTLEQVKARRPLLGWEKRYSAPEMTTDALVEELYREFSAASAQK